MSLSPQKRSALKRGRSGIRQHQAAAIMGLDPNYSAFEVWAEKQGHAVPRSEAWAMTAPAWGQLKETVLAHYLVTAGRVLLPQPKTVIQKMKGQEFCEAGIQHMISPPSGVEEDAQPGVLEVVFLSDEEAAYWDDEGLPVYLMARLQHVLMVLGPRYRYATLVALLGGRRIEWQDVERDDRLIEVLQVAEERFWGLVESGEPPTDMGQGDRVAAMLMAMHPKDDGATIPLGPELVPVDERILELGRSIEELKKEREALKNRLRREIGPFGVGVLPNGAVWRWKNVEQRAYTVKAKTFRKLWRRKG